MKAVFSIRPSPPVHQLTEVIQAEGGQKREPGGKRAVERWRGGGVGCTGKRLGLICKWKGWRDWILRRIEAAIFFSANTGGCTKKPADVVSRRTSLGHVTWRYPKPPDAGTPFLILEKRTTSIFWHASRRLISPNARMANFCDQLNYSGKLPSISFSVLHGLHKLPFDGGLLRLKRAQVTSKWLRRIGKWHKYIPAIHRSLFFKLFHSIEQSFWNVFSMHRIKICWPSKPVVPDTVISEATCKLWKLNRLREILSIYCCSIFLGKKSLSVDWKGGIYF